MKTVGEILKTARKKKKIKLDEVAKATKIKKEFLRAIEKNDWRKIPFEVTARGFIKNYAEFLGLSSKSVLAVFRRDFNFDPKKEIVPKEILKTLGDSRFSWSPKATLALIVFVTFLTLVFYLGYQYLSLVKNPRLELFQPQEDEQIPARKVEVVGRVDSDSTVTVNGSLVSSSPKGEFRFTLVLLPGENKIVVEAVNRLGRKSQVERTVLVSDTE